MPYYAGDFYGYRYSGDYYAGDPGRFFSILARGARKLLPAAATMVPGGSTLARVGARIVGSRAGRALSRAAQLGKTMVRAHPAGTAVVGAVATAGAAAAIEHRATPTAAGMAIRPGMEAVPGMGFGRRRRRMRVTNPKALRRAIRRATGFARLARKVLTFTSPKAPRGRARFRVPRRRTARVRV